MITHSPLWGFVWENASYVAATRLREKFDISRAGKYREHKQGNTKPTARSWSFRLHAFNNRAVIQNLGCSEGIVGGGQVQHAASHHGFQGNDTPSTQKRSKYVNAISQ